MGEMSLVWERLGNAWLTVRSTLQFPLQNYICAAEKTRLTKQEVGRTMVFLQTGFHGAYRWRKTCTDEGAHKLVILHHDVKLKYRWSILYTAAVRSQAAKLTVHTEWAGHVPSCQECKECGHTSMHTSISALVTLTLQLSVLYSWVLHIPFRQKRVGFIPL